MHVVVCNSVEISDELVHVLKVPMSEIKPRNISSSVFKCKNGSPRIFNNPISTRLERFVFLPPGLKA